MPKPKSKTLHHLLHTPVVISPIHQTILLMILTIVGLLSIFRGYLTQPLPIPDPSQTELEQFLSANITLLLPTNPETPLSNSTKESFQHVIHQITGINALTSYQGQQLNHVYGYMGAEQHIPRYPGDKLKFTDPYFFTGMTKSPGAFGYFANSAAELTPEDIQAEKFYIVVQTLYLPNWNQDWPTLKPWYKHRKMLVINPLNGKAAVAVIADAGPARYTGKHFGASPELIAHLDYKKRPRPSLILFIPDETAANLKPGPLIFTPDTSTSTFLPK